MNRKNACNDRQDCAHAFDFAFKWMTKRDIPLIMSLTKGRGSTARSQAALKGKNKRQTEQWNK